jgi:hypothetical protein
MDCVFRHGLISPLLYLGQHQSAGKLTTFPHAPDAASRVETTRKLKRKLAVFNDLDLLFLEWGEAAKRAGALFCNLSVGRIASNHSLLRSAICAPTVGCRIIEE